MQETVSGKRVSMSAPDSEAPAPRKGLTAGPDAAGLRLDQWLAASARRRLFAQPPAGADPPGRGQRRRRGRHRAEAQDGGGRRGRDRAARTGAGRPAGRGHRLSRPLRGRRTHRHRQAAGLVVHPGAGNWTGTLVNALINHCGDSLSGIGGVRRPGIVHRLDKDTSGVMVVAKTDRAHRALSEAFADHGRAGDLERAYVALVWNVPARMSGTIDTLARARLRPRQARRRAGRPRRRPPCGHPLHGARALSPRAAPTSRRRRWSSAGWRPAVPTRSASTWPISAIRWSATATTAWPSAPRPTSCPNR